MSRVALDDVFERSERIVSRRIAGEQVLVPLAARAADLDALFQLNEVGTFIWERLDGTATGHDVVRALTGAFRVSASRAASDYAGFLERLERVGAVRRRA